MGTPFPTLRTTTIRTGRRRRYVIDTCVQEPDKLYHPIAKYNFIIEMPPFLYEQLIGIFDIRSNLLSVIKLQGFLIVLNLLIARKPTHLWCVRNILSCYNNFLLTALQSVKRAPKRAQLNAEVERLKALSNIFVKG